MRAYIPPFIEGNYLQGRLRGRLRCSVLVADISGFTGLTEAAFRLGEHGVELMSLQLERVFNPLTDAVLTRDGVITGFTGDGFVAVFPRDPGRRACSAAREIIEFFKFGGRVETPAGAFVFNAKCGISRGTVHWGIVGDRPEKEQTFYFRGKPIIEAAGLESKAASGEVLVCPGIPESEKEHVQPGAATSGEPDFQNSEQVLSLFVDHGVLALGGTPEIRPVVSVFVGLCEGSGREVRELTRSGTIDGAVSVIRRAASACQGTFNKLEFGDKGCTVLCIFGAPRSVERPVVAAMRFIRRLHTEWNAETRRERGPLRDARFRVGVDTGLAYAGIVGGLRRNEWTCIGDCVNVSARLMTEAQWGEARVSSRVCEAGSGHFEFVGAGAVCLKGKTLPEETYTLMGETRTGSGVSGERALMVGRTAELGRLHAAFVRAKEGTFAGMMYVYGEPGMGKTRLVAEFRNQLETARHAPGPPEAARRAAGLQSVPAHGEADGFQWVRVPCLEGDSGLKPVSVWLEGFFGLTAFETPTLKRARIEAKLEEIADSAASGTADETRATMRQVTSFLAALVGCHWEGSLYSQVSDPKLRYENQLRAAKELIKALAATVPLVLEIEDSHWIEPSTAEWVGMMTRNVDNTPFMILLTSRYGEDGRKPRVSVDREVEVEEIELKGLDRSLAATMIEQRAGARPGSALLDFVCGRTDGNPFFIDQLAAHMQESGLLGEQDGAAVLAGDIGRLPATLDSLLLARFDRLDGMLREGLKHAATLGVRFFRGVLEELLRLSDHFSGDPNLIVPGGEKSGMIVPEGPATGGTVREIATAVSGEREPADASEATRAWLFRHILMQRAAYHLQMPSVRTQLHRLAAEVIEKLFPGRQEFCRELADHYGKAGIVEKEVDYLERAAKLAADSFKNSESTELYTRLISRLVALAGSDSGSVVDARASLVRARFGLARTWKLVGRWAEAIEEYEKGLALAGEMKDTKQQVDGLALLSDLLRLRGRMQEALQATERAIALADSAGYASGKASALGHRGFVFSRLGEYSRAMECFELSLKLSEEVGDKSKKAGALNSIGNILLFRGDNRRAMEHYEQAVRLVEELGDKIGATKLLGNMGIVHRKNGDYAEAMSAYRSSLKLAEELGDKDGMARATGNMGNLFLAQGEYAQALEHFEKRLRFAWELGDRDAKAGALGSIGLVRQYQGNHRLAMDYFKEYLRLSEEVGSKEGQARAAANMARLHMELGEFRVAEDHLARYTQLAEELKSREHRAQALCIHGALLTSTGNHEAAVERLKTGIGIWRELRERQEMAAPHLAFAEACVALRRPDEARPAFEEARSLVKTFGLKRLERQVERVKELLARS
ncbi:MAG: tetratricopeptide repeat protein [Planctomycetota bacterium]|nr:tetratricopeptide repeat protein [Planctomycetota bacterium]